MAMGRTAALAAAMVIGAMAARGLAADEPAMLTPVELKQLVDSGQYRDALKAMIRILQLKGTAAAAYDRHELLMLRAECQLQIKETRAAMDTLELARKEAVAASDDAHGAQAMAMALLIQKSPGLVYTPKTGPLRKPLSILDRTVRKAAYDALFGDELAPLEIKAKVALKATSLAPIAEAAKLAGPVRAVEFVSTGSNRQTDQITSDLTKQSLKLLANALEDLTARTQQISDAANRVITDSVPVSDGMGHTYVQQQSRRQGLKPQDPQTLKGIKSDCEKIPAGAAELAQGLGADPAPFKKIATKADLLKDKVNTLLTDDYSVVAH